MNYEVILPKTVQKELDRLSSLEANPRPADVKKLKGRLAWRIRIGDYRAIYEINDQSRKIIVVTVAQRREVYR